MVLLFHFRFGFGRFFSENCGFGFSQFRFLHEILVKQTINCKRNDVISPDGDDSSTKVCLSQRVIRLSGNSTPGGHSVTSNGAGGSPAKVIIRLFGDVFDWAGPFLKFEKNRHMAV